MNCRDTELLILAERDSVLTSEQRASLSTHVAGCPRCRQLRSTLSEAMTGFRHDAATVAVPDAAEAWRELSAGLHETPAKPERKRRPLAPINWFGAPLAAAAAVSFAFFVGRPSAPTLSPSTSVAESARADYVEAGDVNASTMVYVDKDSGWLVVWAADAGTKVSE